MKISKSKQELARIISENGGWRDEAESSAQCAGGEISFWSDTATKRPGEDWRGSYLGSCDDIEFTGVKLPNWHQTILSRDEYFHLYPATDADGWIAWKGGECPVDKGVVIDVKFRNGTVQTACAARCDKLPNHRYWTWIWSHSGHESDIIAYRMHKPEQAKPECCESVMRSIQEPEIHSKNIDITQVDDINVVESKPTIEQLAADYRNANDYAERKQQEADAAKADADAKLKALELAGEALGLLVSPITAKQEAELVIEVNVGDEVECVESNIKRDKYNGMVGRLRLIDESDTSTPYLVDFGGNAKIWCHEVKFIRRP